ncbi:MAG TPA: MobF family relaxase [Acidimicrobiales bacterium]|nr:MobF family relaxase [Acidimicrobiales bacterium]
MLIVKPVSPGVVGYFTAGREPGRWTAGASALLDLSGPVTPGDLRCVLEGRHPATGRSLVERRRVRRRAGWDLAFCAPKSFSLLAASGTPAGAVALAAHAAAVEAVATDLEEHVRVRQPAGPGALPHGCGTRLVGATFSHALSAAGEPHLHTHLLVANLTLHEGRWRALDPSPWTIDRRAASALYHLALRHELASRGVHLQWRLRPDGLADLAGAGREALRAASTQSRLVAQLGRYAARRAAETAPPGPAAKQAAARQSGAGLAAAAALPETGGSDRFLGDARLERVVATRLAVRRSDFRQADVLVALAASHPGGATPHEARAWAERFCASSLEVPSPTAGRRWTTALARGADDQLATLLGRLPRPAPLAVAAETAHTMAARSPTGWQTARRMAESPAAVHLLGVPPGASGILGHAEILDACRAAWEAAGLRCAVWTPDGRGEARWAVLSGLSPYRAGERPDVLVVDQADRRPTGELLQAAAEVGARAGRLVLVEGGTLPRLSSPASRGLYEAGAPRVELADPAPWRPGGPATAAVEETGRAAAARVLDGWLSARLAGRPVAMVGLGPEEICAFNEAARAALGLPAERTGAVAARRGVLVGGDRVVTVRGGGRLPPYATLGTVEAVRPAAGEATIRWDGREEAEAYGRGELSGVAAGHALSVATALCAGVPAVLLGPPRAGRGLQLVGAVGRRPGHGRGLELSPAFGPGGADSLSRGV